eukprot:g33627.t1
MNGRWWETADRQVVAVNALEIVPVGQCSLVWMHRYRVEVPQVGDVVGGWIDHDRLQRRIVVVPLVDFGGGVARVVDLVDFWDRRGGSAVSSDVVGAGAVVTFLCCSAVSGPALAMTGVWYSLLGPKPCAWCCCSISRENSSKVVVIVAGGDRSLKQDRCRPGRWSVLQGVHVAGAGCQSRLPRGASGLPTLTWTSVLAAARRFWSRLGFLGSSGTFSWYFTICWLMTYNRGSMTYFVYRLY